MTDAPTKHTGEVTFVTQETGREPPAGTGDRPAWQPEGFTGDQAALAKSWADQRSEVTRLQQELAKVNKAPEAAPPAPNNSPPGEGEAPVAPQPPKIDAAAAAKVTQAAGFDASAYQSEYDQSGDVSAESRGKIAEGLKSVLGDNARSVVDEFIDGRKAIHRNDHDLYMQAAGGQEQFQAMSAWAAQNLPAEQLAVYNKSVETRDRHATVFAIEGLKAKFEAAVGREPSLLRASGGAASGTSGFANSAQMVTAMSDPRYQKDQAYRDEVARKIAASQF